MDVNVAWNIKIVKSISQRFTCLQTTALLKYTCPPVESPESDKLGIGIPHL